MTFATKKSNLISKVNFEISRKKKTEIRGSYDKITGSFCKMKFSSWKHVEKTKLSNASKISCCSDYTRQYWLDCDEHQTKTSNGIRGNCEPGGGGEELSWHRRLQAITNNHALRTCRSQYWRTKAKGHPVPPLLTIVAWKVWRVIIHNVPRRIKYFFKILRQN